MSENVSSPDSVRMRLLQSCNIFSTGRSDEQQFFYGCECVATLPENRCVVHFVKMERSIRAPSSIWVLVGLLLAIYAVNQLAVYLKCFYHISWQYLGSQNSLATWSYGVMNQKSKFVQSAWIDPTKKVKVTICSDVLVGAITINEALILIRIFHANDLIWTW